MSLIMGTSSLIAFIPYSVEVLEYRGPMKLTVSGIVEILELSHQVGSVNETERENGSNRYTARPSSLVHSAILQYGTILFLPELHHRLRTSVPLD
jgi:hypothetical protein